jgi:hypothetical protein
MAHGVTSRQSLKPCDRKASKAVCNLQMKKEFPSAAKWMQSERENVMGKIHMNARAGGVPPCQSAAGFTNALT